MNVNLIIHVNQLKCVQISQIVQISYQYLCACKINKTINQEITLIKDNVNGIKIIKLVQIKNALKYSQIVKQIYSAQKF